jgi:hypothetical protein
MAVLPSVARVQVIFAARLTLIGQLFTLGLFCRENIRTFSVCKGD